MPEINPPALILIDMQMAFRDEAYWGGARNNPDAEEKALSLLSHWRSKDWPVFHIQHNSADPNSILKTNRPEGAPLPGFEALEDETVIEKNVNSAFIGTDLEERLRASNINTLVICGLTTNHCVSTTTRMAGNLGFDVTLVGDACATFARTGPDGQSYTAQDIHDISLANIHGEFCTVMSAAKALEKLA
ncbi:MAG: cysteine hydrolase family protein [Maricaulaceae bacterium]